MVADRRELLNRVDSVRDSSTIDATDDFGFAVVDDWVHANDLHTTMLGLMGIDHEELTYLFDGRYRRLTDVGVQNNFAPRLVKG